MDEEKYLARYTPVKDMVHKIGEKEEIRVSREAIECLQIHIDQLARILINQSKNNAIDGKRKTIKEVDVIDAFELLIRPNAIIDESINELYESIKRLEATRGKGFSKYLEV